MFPIGGATPTESVIPNQRKLGLLGRGRAVPPLIRQLEYFFKYKNA